MDLKDTREIDLDILRQFRHVIEQIVEPIDVLDALNQTLKPGESIIIITFIEDKKCLIYGAVTGQRNCLEPLQN